MTIEPDDMRDYHNIACAFAQMGEPDRALDLLETCLPKAHLLAWIKREPELMPLHGHPRYQALIAREEARLAAIAIGQAS